MEAKFCQSCGMEISKDELLGTNSDKSLNNDYCVYCFKDGEFTTDSTMNDMIEISVKHMEEMGILKQNNKTKDEAIAFMKSFFPELKRWKCTCTNECASGYNANCTCASSECHCTVNAE